MGSLLGVEVELENVGNVFSGDEKITFWEVTQDNSLRDFGVEFRFKGPLSYKNTKIALSKLETSILEKGINPRATFRTSVHVHVNVRDMTVDQMFKFILVYLIFEKPLFRLHGRRSDNHFCVPYFKGEGALEKLSCFTRYLNGEIDKYRLASYIHSCYKYSAMNIKRYPDIGTFEFRHMEGTYKAKDIIQWIDIILKLKKFVITKDFSYKGLAGMVSAISPMEFFNQVFEELCPILDYTDLVKDMYSGIRLADYVVNLNNLELI